MEHDYGTRKAPKSVLEDTISSMPKKVVTNILVRLPIQDVFLAPTGATKRVSASLRLKIFLLIKFSSRAIVFFAINLNRGSPNLQNLNITTPALSSWEIEIGLISKMQLRNVELVSIDDSDLSNMVDDVGKDSDGLNSSHTKVTPGNSFVNKEGNLHDEKVNLLLIQIK
ncbi:hypothetical protein Tco_1161058, partial [Tanacetum coccineum]